MLEIDYTVFIQVANFLVLLLLLNILLYTPIRGILAKRREQETALKNSTEDFQSQADQNEKSIEQGRVEARKTGVTEKEGIKSSGHEKEQGILQDAISTADEKLENARKEIDAKIDDVRKSLEDQVALFSNDLAEKILGRSI